MKGFLSKQAVFCLAIIFFILAFLPVPKVTAQEDTLLNLIVKEAPQGIAGYEIKLQVEAEKIIGVELVAFGNEVYQGQKFSQVDIEDETVFIQALDIEDKVRRGATDVLLARIHLQGLKSSAITQVLIDDDLGSSLPLESVWLQETTPSVTPPPPDDKEKLDDKEKKEVVECPGGLVPCGRECDNPDTEIDETQPCTFCHFFKLIQNIINYIAFRFAPVIAILAVILGAALWMLGGASERLVKWGKDILVGTVWGLVIIYSAWIIINEVLLFFVNPRVFPLPWYQIQCPI